jgi:hypothetical protein
MSCRVLLHRVSFLSITLDPEIYPTNSSHYADPTVLGIATFTMCSMSLLEALVAGPVEVYFAVRVYKCTWVAL